MKLDAYHHSIGYKPGNSHGNADGLSRLPLPKTPGHIPMPVDVVLVLNHIDATMVKASEIKLWAE